MATFTFFHFLNLRFQVDSLLVQIEQLKQEQEGAH
jgi:hypothetical protein